MSTARALATRFTVPALLVLCALGCAGPSGPMRLAEDMSFAPREDKALVVFLRPSTLAFTIQASVFELEGDSNRFIGIVPATRKVAHYAEPGAHLYMVLGESADFLRAELVAGKTYYVRVAARLGAGKARFSLRPVRGSEIDSKETQGWITSTQYVVSTPDAEAWAVQHADSIADKRREYLPRWQGKEQASRDEATLRETDGR